MEKIYELKDLADVLSEMGGYLSENLEDGYLQEFSKELFAKLTSTGLFRDACGKVVDSGKNFVKVSTEY